MDRIATLHVVRERPHRQLLVMARMLTDRWRLRGVDGLVFARVLGTGRGGDTGPSADLRRQAYFLVWRDPGAARAFLSGHPVARRWGTLEVEHEVALGLLSGHGTWSRRPVLDGMRRVDGPEDRAATGDDALGDDALGDDVTGDDVTGDDVTGDDALGDDALGDDVLGDDATGDDVAGLIVLTRARIRVRSWRVFRRASRTTSGPAPVGRCWTLGVGELPLGLLGTVSGWRSTADLDAWLAVDGAHAEAASHADEWFVESLFARFAPVDLQVDDPADLV